MDKNRSLHNSGNINNRLAPIWCTVAPGTSILCQLKIFYLLKKEGLLRRTVDSKVTVLVRLTLYENLFIGQENCMLSALMSVCIK